MLSRRTILSLFQRSRSRYLEHKQRINPWKNECNHLHASLLGYNPPICCACILLGSKSFVQKTTISKKICCALFLFLIIGSNELYTFLIWLLVLIKTCFELYCYPSVYYHLLLPKTKKIITDFPIVLSMKLC